MEKPDFFAWLNIRSHRVLGYLQAALMSLGIKKELFLSLMAVVLTSVIPLYTSFSDLEPTWQWVPLAVSALALLVTIVHVTSQYSHYEKTYYPVPKKYRQEILARMSLPPEMLRAGYRVSHFHNGVQEEWYVASPLVDSYLRGHPGIALACLPRSFGVGREAAFLLPSILAGMLHNSNRLIFNGTLLRQAQELYPDDHSMLVQKSHYFDGQCTNEIVYKKFRSTRQIEPVFDGSHLLHDGENRLFDLGESPCANFMGVSTLAVTRDGMMVIGRQGNASMANAGRYAPSGSGSVDFKDYQQFATSGNRHPTLEQVLIAAMERELQEELNLFGANIPLTTHLLGYARLLERGGKPDYFGLTYMDVDSSILLSKRVSFQEKGLQACYELFPLDARTTAAQTLQAFCAQHRKSRRLSIQLHILAQLLEDLERQGPPIRHG